MKKRAFPVDILVDTGAGGGSYMSLAFYHMTARLGKSVTALTKHGRGALHAASPLSNKTPPMRILGSTTLPLKFPAETRIRNITFRVVDGLPYGLIVGADYLRSEESILDFGPGKGFKHNPNAAWIPFLDHTPPSALIASLTDSLATTTVDATHRTSQPVEDMAWEDDSTLEWDAYLNNGDTSTEGYVSKVVGGYAVGPMPQDKQLAIILPQEAYDLGKTAMVGVAREIIWWKPGTQVVCKLVNRSNEPAKVPTSTPIAHMIALSSRNAHGFQSLFDKSPSTSDPCVPAPPKHSPPTAAPAEAPAECQAKDANLGQLGPHQKRQLTDILREYITAGLFPSDPKRVPACIGGELTLPLKNETCTPVAEKQRRFSPEERHMTREETKKLLDRGIIRPSNSPWAAQCLCVKKKDGTLRLCIDWRALNEQLVADSGGLGDIQTIFDGLEGKKFFTQIDLASVYHQVEIAAKDKYKTAFRDPDGQLCEFNRAGYDLTVLPSAFTRILRNALRLPDDDVASWLDDILIASLGTSTSPR